MTPERLRQRALLCLRFAEASTDEVVATRLKLMAGEFLMEAEKAEQAPGFVPAPKDKEPDTEPETEPA